MVQFQTAARNNLSKLMSKMEKIGKHISSATKKITTLKRNYDYAERKETRNCENASQFFCANGFQIF